MANIKHDPSPYGCIDDPIDCFIASKILAIFVFGCRIMSGRKK
jgi:hypothetical protein